MEKNDELELGLMVIIRALMDDNCYNLETYFKFEDALYKKIFGEVHKNESEVYSKISDDLYNMITAYFNFCELKKTVATKGCVCEGLKNETDRDRFNFAISELLCKAVSGNDFDKQKLYEDAKGEYKKFFGTEAETEELVEKMNEEVGVPLSRYVLYCELNRALAW